LRRLHDDLLLRHEHPSDATNEIELVHGYLLIMKDVNLLRVKIADTEFDLRDDMQDSELHKLLQHGLQQASPVQTLLVQHRGEKYWISASVAHIWMLHSLGARLQFQRARSLRVFAGILSLAAICARSGLTRMLRRCVLQQGDCAQLWQDYSVAETPYARAVCAGVPDSACIAVLNHHEQQLDLRLLGHWPVVTTIAAMLCLAPRHVALGGAILSATLLRFGF
jgi:hypothetical protein